MIILHHVRGVIIRGYVGYEYNRICYAKPFYSDAIMFVFDDRTLDFGENNRYIPHSACAPIDIFSGDNETVTLDATQVNIDYFYLL